MAKVEPSELRIKITDEAGGLRIIIPSKRNWFLILFLGFWICGWAVGEVVVPSQFFKGTTPTEPFIFTLAWLGAWTVGGAFAIYVWLWNIVGKEIISVNGQILSVRRAIGNYGRDKDFALAHVRDLRLSSMTLNPFDFSSGMQFWGIGGGCIAFDYGAKTHRFGSGLDEAEAKHVVNAIKQRFKV